MSRPIPNTTLGGFRPNQVKINSIGIGIDDDTLDALNLDSSQFMVVGGQANDVYNLVVDSEGVIINSSLPNRAAGGGEYALYVDGNIYVSGKVDTSAGTLSNIAGGGGGPAFACNYWMPVRRDIPSSTNIFYDGRINLANESLSRSNTYRLNIADNANYTIRNAQMAIQNQVGGVARAAILGYSNLSPLVFNTNRGAIEFHAGREQQYYDSVYYRDGQYQNLPAYTGPVDAPHLAIQRDGNVGVKVSPNPPLTYTLRTVNELSPPEVVPTTVAGRPADLHVDGALYACNLVMYDYESRATKNVDELYVRRLGVTFAASQVEPGLFGPGDYSFRSNVSIGGPINEEMLLTVYGKVRILDQLYTDKAFLTSNLVIQDTMQVNGSTFFEGDVIANENFQVNQNLVIWGGLYADSNALLTIVPGGSNQNTTAQVNFVGYVADGWSNIYPRGAGFITPGKVGVGINTMYDSTPGQLSVISRDKDIYSLALLDKTSADFTKALFIGHQRSNIVQNVDDASVIFATPSSTSPFFSYTQASYPQNMYFYPGRYDKTIQGSNTARDDNPPVLAICESGQVSINSFQPNAAAQLYVHGSIGFSSNLYVYDSPNVPTKLAQFRYGPVVGISGNIGVRYIDPSVPYMGIHREADLRYGVTIQGGLQADTFYTSNHRKAVLWRDSITANAETTATAPDGAYLISKVGIGINSPQYMLDIWGDNAEIGNEHGTYIRLSKSTLDEGFSNTGIRLDGTAQPWFINVESLTQSISRYSVACSSDVYSLVSTTSSNSSGLLIQHDTSKALNGHQVVIGGNASLVNQSVQNPNPNPSAVLTVNGDTSILGNLNVTGIITANNIVDITPSERSNVPVIEADDLFISGKDVFMNPTNKLYVNYTSSMLQYPVETGNRAVLNVYQDIFNSGNPAPIAHFVGEGDNTYIEIMSKSINASGTGVNDGILRIGLLSADTTNGQVIGFQDGAGTSYMTFRKLGNARRAMGINTQEPEAQLHIVNDSTAMNPVMARFTYNNGTLGDTANFTPNLMLEKEYGLGGDSYQKQWVLQGPTYGTDLNDQLAFKYVQAITNSLGETMVTSNTVLSITSNGCVGINQTSPTYLLDILSYDNNDGRNHGIRLWNSMNQDIAQLVFQSGASPDVGGDEFADYVMYSCNSEFLFRQRKTGGSTTPLLYANSNARLGILTTPNTSYDVTLGGSVLVDGGLWGQNATLTGTLVASNIYAYGTFVSEVSLSSSNLSVSNITTPDPALSVYQGVGGGGGYAVADFYDLNATADPILRIAQGGNIGMGTTLPRAKLDVIGDALVSGNVGIGNTASLTILEVFGYSLVYGSIGIGTTAPLAALHVEGGAYLGASVGIGTTTPGAALDVVGDGLVSGNVGIGTTAPGAALDVVGDGLVSGNVGIGTTAPQAALHVEGGVYFGGNLGLGTTLPQAALDVTGDSLVSGNVGIGTTIPKAALDVTGDGIVSGNFGIGTIAPQTPLHVEGVAYVGGSLGIGTMTPASSLSVHGNAIIGKGLLGEDSTTAGGPFFLQNSWDGIGTEHTMFFPLYCLGENSAGTLHIQVTNKSTTPGNEKIGTLQAAFFKQYGSNVDVSEISKHKNTNLTTLAIRGDNSDIIVETDSDCHISWTSIGSY